MKMKEEKKFDTNRLFYYANEYMLKPTSNEELQGIDMTEEFWKEIEEEIKNDELIDINLNAKVRMSKSTSGIYIGQRIFDLLIKHGKRKDGTYGIKNIARDQQEYSKMMRDPEVNHTVIVTDEINELEETGENASVEKALNNVFSNVQAGRYVHRVSCSPQGISDPNADIFLEVISVDKKRMLTHAHLYYRMFKGGNMYMQMLGYVNIFVGDLIKNWEKKIKGIFFKKDKTPNEIKLIEEYRKKDYYIEYIIKKYEKMNLITKEGIMRPRMLDYAEIILNVEERLRKLAKYNILNKNTIKNYIKMYCRKEKIPTSIVGEELMTQEVEGILSLWKNYFGILAKIEKIQSRFSSGKIDEESFRNQEDALIQVRDEILNVITSQREELERYREINKEYNFNASEGEIINK